LPRIERLSSKQGPAPGCAGREREGETLVQAALPPWGKPSGAGVYPHEDAHVVEDNV